MKRTIRPPDDPIELLLMSAEYGYARSMLDTLRRIQAEPWQHTYNDLVTRDHAAMYYLPWMINLRWIQPDRVAPKMSGREPRWRLSPHKLERDMGAFIELLEEICGD